MTKTANVERAAYGFGLVGACLVVVAKFTPWYTDYNAYSTSLSVLEAKAAAQPLKSAIWSNAFYDNLHHCRTHKWLYADVGYALIAWAILLLIVCVFARKNGWSALLTTRTNVFVVGGLALVACFLFWSGLLIGIFEDDMREGLPPWADSIDIPIYSINHGMTFQTPIVMLWALWPCIWWRRSDIRFSVSGPFWRMLVATMLSLPFLLVAGICLFCTFNSGGWALSIAGLIFVWLALNARTIVIGPRSAVVRPVISAG